MTGRCKHCNTDGHTTRACLTKSGGGGGGGGGGVRLFGVRLTDGSFFKKSASMGNLSHCSAAAAAVSPEGYHSDNPDRGSAAVPRIRKRGVPWTEEEHRQFLLGLHKVGKGHWLSISKGFVSSRTPSQVASHAQKYFMRQSDTGRKRKRASLFDMAPQMYQEINAPMPPPVITENKAPSLELSLKPTFTTLPFHLWPSNAYPLKEDEEGTSLVQNPVVPEASMVEVVALSKLSLGETAAMEAESSLSL
ncbi:hypothetical protein ABFX02_09G103400 [Erythranthe guttata]